LGSWQQHEQVGHARDGGLALADAHGLDDHDVVARSLADQHRLARLLATPPRLPLAGLGRM